jgi:hypothetical protein
MSNDATGPLDAFGTIRELTLGGRRIVAFVPNRIVPTTPILVAHDAQNYMVPTEQTWNGLNWGVAEAIAAGRIRGDANGNLPLILSMHLTDVATRLNELAPQDFFDTRPEIWAQLVLEKASPSTLLTGNKYVDDIANLVIPEACELFGITHSAERTAVSGSSMGGLASLYALGRHPQTFGWALAFSTHWPIGGKPLVEYLFGQIPTDGTHRVWTDRGTIGLDASYEPFHAAAVAELNARGFRRDVDFIAAEFHGTEHSETFWARRIEYPINWWLETKKG